MKYLPEHSLVLELTTTTENSKLNGLFHVKQYSQAIPYWMKTDPNLKASPIIYVKILIDALERDLVKLRGIQVLDNPSQIFEMEIGSKVYGDGDMMDEDGAISTIIDYVENLINVLNGYCGEYKP